MGANGYPAPFNFASPETSGELRTKYNNFKYGYYEFRIKPPTNTNGNFIATTDVTGGRSQTSLIYRGPTSPLPNTALPAGPDQIDLDPGAAQRHARVK